MKTATGYVIFKLGKGRYGLPVEQVHSITSALPVTPVPYLPTEVKGLVNFRGDLCMTLDAAKILEPESQTQNGRAFLLVLNRPDPKQKQRGLWVDEIFAVLTEVEARQQPDVQLIDIERIFEGSRFS
jgi:chemotaxis signal transduction protein